MLDKKEVYPKVDPGGMKELIESFPVQFQLARKNTHEVDFSNIDTERINNIVVCGMGGSAIGGDLVKSYLLNTIEVPIYINRDYSIPAFVNQHTLVVGSSYSGNTEETLNAFKVAGKAGAQRVAVSTGGKIAGICQAESIPIVTLPGGLPPRAALGYSFTPFLTILEILDLIENQDNYLEETVEILKRGIELYGPDNPADDNPAKELAAQLHGKLPLIYSDDNHFNSAAVRFRGQINENAKQLAYSAVFPENNHNELVGWKHLDGLSEILVAIYLYDSSIASRVKFRMRFFSEIQNNLGVETYSIESRGESLLARIFSVIQYCDWISYYMAILNQEDPMPVKIIDKLKSSLASFKG